MKIIARTKDGLLAEMSGVEAVRLSGNKSPDIGLSFNPLSQLTQSEEISRQLDKLRQVNTDIKSLSSRIDLIERER